MTWILMQRNVQDKTVNIDYTVTEMRLSNIGQENAGYWLQRNSKKESESLLLTAHINSIRINYIKVKIEQNSKCR